MKILWFSNKSILNSHISGSGSWLFGMSSNLINHYPVEIVNITESKSAKSVTYCNNNSITEWVIPHAKLTKGLPSAKVVNVIKQIVDDCNPDIIHVWGVEGYWGLLFSRGYITGYKTLLEIQGVLFACFDNYRNNLYFQEFYKVQPLYQALYSFFYVYFQSVKFYRRLKYEKEILSYFKNIAYQSNWTFQKIEFFSDATYFHSLRPIRPQFFAAAKWNYLNHNNKILTVVSGEGYKGLHVTLKAVALLKEKIPDITIFVAGITIAKFNRGYLQYISCLIKKLDIHNNVVLLGSLCADQLIERFLSVNCLVISSFVESYSAVFAEAMCIGVPTVVSFSGAMIEFAVHNESALFYTPGDYYQCAANIEKLITNHHLAEQISRNSMSLSIKNNDDMVADNQMCIYEKVISK